VFYECWLSKQKRRGSASWLRRTALPVVSCLGRGIEGGIEAMIGSLDQFAHEARRAPGSGDPAVAASAFSDGELFSHEMRSRHVVRGPHSRRTRSRPESVDQTWNGRTGLVHWLTSEVSGASVFGDRTGEVARKAFVGSRDDPGGR